MPGVYISYPFCDQKCSFCNFASGVFPRQWQGEYLDGLRREIAAHVWQWKPETVYLGGGTPSNISIEELASILELIPGRPWKEATIEAAPGSFSAETAAGWKTLGLNRASLGVQSFVKSELARTGRRHDADTVAHDVAALRNAGIEHINLDLIAGLPGQTKESWRESLDHIERVRPDHVSVYLFEVDEDSRLGKEVILGSDRYGAHLVPNDGMMADLYEAAVARLAAIGIPRYEISNFAVPGSESLHNCKYWLREPYIGFGADAHSFDGMWRWQNVETAREYVERWRESRPVQEERTLADADEERFFVGLRLSAGIEPSAEDWHAHRAAIERFVSAGLLSAEGNRLRLTDRGVLLSNEVLQEFLHT